MTDRLANESLTEFDRTFRVSACTLAGEVGADFFPSAQTTQTV